MTFLEILAILRVAGEITEYAADLIARLHSEGRDPTPDEVAAVKEKQAQAEAAWAEALSNNAAPSKTGAPAPQAPLKAQASAPAAPTDGNAKPPAVQ